MDTVRSSRPRRRRAAAVIGLAALFAAPASAIAQSAEPPQSPDQAAAPASAVAHSQEPPRTPDHVETPAMPVQPDAVGAPEPTRQFTVPSTPDSVWVKLVTRAKKQGRVPVIVGLKVKVTPEGALDAPSRNAQRKLVTSKRNAALRVLAGRRFSHIKDLSPAPFLAMHAGADAIAALKKSSHVASIEEDQLFELNGVTTSSNTNLPAWWHYYATKTDVAMSKGFDGRGQTVAVLDTGAQSTHPWLSGKVVNEACFSTPYSWSSKGGCPNGSTTQYGAGSAQPCTFHARCAHGTSVSHVAAGRYGVASGSKIISVQVFHRTYNGQPGNWNSDLLRAMKHVYDLRYTHRIAAVNVSLGGGQWWGKCDGYDSDGQWRGWTSASTSYWIAMLRSAHIATVIASGNDGYTNALNNPACNSEAVSVGGTTFNTNGFENVFQSSNSASMLSMLAPGASVCTAVPHAPWYVAESQACVHGTSFAAPQVAGAIALHKQLRPNATVSASVLAMQNSGPLIDPYGLAKRRLDIWTSLVYLYNH